MANESLDGLIGNVRQYEIVEFILNVKVAQFTFETEIALVRSKIQQINSNNNLNNSGKKGKTYTIKIFSILYINIYRNPNFYNIRQIGNANFAHIF